MIDSTNTAAVKKLYYDFYEQHRQPNPTDLNTVEKYEHAFEIGFENLRLMQAARKESCDYTVYRTWVDEKNREAMAAHKLTTTRV